MTPPESQSRIITSYDVLKTLAVFLMIIDHVGLYLYPDVEMLRVIGRMSAPIWLFLIGFSRSRDVPFAWIFWFVMDLAVSWAVGIELKADMLLTLSLVRLSLNAIEPLLAPRNHYTVAFFAFILVLTPLTQPFFEYGTYAWAMAAIGFWARREGAKALPWMTAAFFGYFATQSLDFHFSNAGMLVFAGGLTCLAALLIGFDPNARMQLSSRWSAAIYQFCGRYSLVFYALHLMALKILWFFVH